MKSALNILHICNDYLGSKVHRELYEHLYQLGIKQTVFIPMRKTTMGKLHETDRHKLSYKLIPSATMSKYHRYLFGWKKRFLYKSLLKKIDINTINLVHATTLYSDGALALKINQTYGIPYIVTVRNTDISIFLKYRPDLTYLVLNILKNAKQIIFITHALQEKFFEKLSPFEPIKNLDQKCTVIPNGVNQFWLSNIKAKRDESPFKIIYVGSLHNRKNVPALANGILELRKKFKNLQLTIVGGGGSDLNIIKNLATMHPDCIKYLGQISDKESLVKLYANHHIFAMPSYNETFGLVYIEALTQGLPVLYSKDDGVDGFIPANAGVGINPKASAEIKRGLESIINNYNSFDLSDFNFNNFEWQSLAKNYYSIYQRYTDNSSF